jgi:hypothetical protein
MTLNDMALINVALSDMPLVGYRECTPPPGDWPFGRRL